MKPFLRLPSVAVFAATLVIAPLAGIAADDQDVDTGQTAGTEVAKTELSGVCSPSQTKFRTAADTIRIASETFETAPSTKFKIRPKGPSSHCVIVTLTAESVVHNGNMQIQARVGSIYSDPVYLGIREHGDYWQTRTFIFAFRDVPSGKKTVAIEYRCSGTCPTSGPEGGVAFRKRTLTAAYD